MHVIARTDIPKNQLFELALCRHLPTVRGVLPISLHYRCERNAEPEIHTRSSWMPTARSSASFRKADSHGVRRQRRAHADRREARWVRGAGLAAGGSFPI